MVISEQYPELEGKYNRLEQILTDMESVAIGFSGGVDSSLIAFVASRLLADRALAVTIRSPVESPEETEQAIQIAQQAKIRHLVVDMNDLADPVFVANPPDRCYHCKLRRFQALREIAKENDLRWMADGTNADDAGYYRPGMRALAEIGVRSPLSEAGLKKSEIRELSRILNLPNWAKPAAPCLATRFPYNVQLTQENIRRVAQAESYLHRKGFTTIRVRVHPDLSDQSASSEPKNLDLARIEVDIQSFPRILEIGEEIVAYLHNLGYGYVTLDLAGYRSGSMDEGLIPATSIKPQGN
jgi:pyridinium-3,5-biscarboxylic acid mononucleotide sulfurtransferase